MNIDLTDRDQLERYLRDKHIQPEQTSGQNFMVCPEVPEAIVAAMEGGPMRVTELGAGLGTLTQQLAAGNYEVRAIERDARLAKSLEQLMPPAGRKKVEVRREDLRTCSWSWTTPYQLVGNIPYNLSGLIVRLMTRLEPAPERVILLVQKEVGERLAAEAPNSHLISVAVRLWGRADPLMNVPADCFWPAPQVNSQLVMLTPRPEQKIDLKARERILGLAKIFFQGKRKQVGGVLKRQWDIDDAKVRELLGQAKISKESRPQEITVGQWIDLWKLLK